jgi:hypothetical protein
MKTAMSSAETRNERCIKLVLKTVDGAILRFTILPGKLLRDDDFIQFIDRDGRTLEYNKQLILSKEELP